MLGLLVVLCAAAGGAIVGAEVLRQVAAKRARCVWCGAVGPLKTIDDHVRSCGARADGQAAKERELRLEALRLGMRLKLLEKKFDELTADHKVVLERRDRWRARFEAAQGEVRAWKSVGAYQARVIESRDAVLNLLVGDKPAIALEDHWRAVAQARGLLGLPVGPAYSDK